MTEERRGQIALIYVKKQLADERFRLNPNTLREIGSKASALGIPKEEAIEFFEGLIREAVEEMFPHR